MNEYEKEHILFTNLSHLELVQELKINVSNLLNISSIKKERFLESLNDIENIFLTTPVNSNEFKIFNTLLRTLENSIELLKKKSDENRWFFITEDLFKSIIGSVNYANNLDEICISRFRIIYTTFYLTGLKIAPIAKLTKKDFDHLFETSTLTVEKVNDANSENKEIELIHLSFNQHEMDLFSRIKNDIQIYFVDYTFIGSTRKNKKKIGNRNSFINSIAHHLQAIQNQFFTKDHKYPTLSTYSFRHTFIKRKLKDYSISELEKIMKTTIRKEEYL